MTQYNSEKEAQRLKDDLLRNPVLMIRVTPSADDQEALALVRKISTPRVVHRPPRTIGRMVLPRLVAGQSSYEGLDEILHLVEHLSRLTSNAQTTYCE